MSRFEEMLDSRDDSMVSDFPKGFIEEKGKAIRAGAFVGAKGEEGFFFYFRRCGNFGEKGAIIIRDDFRKKIVMFRGKGLLSEG